MNVLVYPPVHGYGLATLFNSVAPFMPAQGVNWELAPSDNKFELAQLYSFPEMYSSFQNLLAAQHAGLRTAAMAVYWNPTRFYTQGLPLGDLPDAAEDSKSAEIRAAMFDIEKQLARAIYRACDVVIAQSPSEADGLAEDFGIARERIVVSYVGAEPRYADASPELFQKKYGLRDFVLCVGRVDPNKNQLSLIRALKDEKLTLVLAGGSIAPPYLEQCRASAGANVHFLPSLTDEELKSAYAAARVHALASWLEVVGFVTLEAAVAGCNVVLSRYHGGRDYVGEQGWYCDPADLDSIRRAVLDAYHAPRQTALRDYLLKTFTWEKHAQGIRAAYDRALQLPPRCDDADVRANLEQATRALVTLVPLLEQSRAALWREKAEAEKTLNAYANGRVMRWLDRLHTVRNER